MSADFVAEDPNPTSEDHSVQCVNIWGQEVGRGNAQRAVWECPIA